MTNIAQRNFAGGEIAPSLYGRTDQQKYAAGLRTLRNFIVQRHGGATNRPGTALVHEVKDSTAAVKLVEFIFDNSAGSNVYLLEFGDRTLRFVQDGGTVVVSGVVAWVTATAYTVGDLRSDGGVTYYATAAHTSGATTEPGVGANWSSFWAPLTGVIYEIPTPYAVGDLPLLQYDQNADVMTLAHPSYPLYELARAGHTRWTLTPVTIGPTIGQASNIASSGGAAGTVRYWAITAIDEATNEEGLPVLYSSIDRIASTGTPTLLTWNPVPGAIEYNVYFSVDGKTYGLKGPAGGIPLAKSDTSWTTTPSSIATTTPNAWVTAANQARNPVVAVVADKAYDGNYSVDGSFALSAAGGSPGITQGRVRVYYSRDGEARQDAGVLADTIAIYGAISSSRPFSGTVFVPDNGYATLTLDFVAEVNGQALSGTPTFTFALDLSVAPYNTVTWSASQTGFSDDGSAPNYQQAPPSQSALFNATNGYPGVVGSYQQRRIVARTNAEPERAWASHPALRSNFATSTPLQDDDMVSWRMVGRRVNEIRHVLDLGQLIVFTSGSEQLVRGDTAGILRPGELNPQKISAHGSDARLAPIEVGDSAIYVQARGSQVRDLKPIADGSYQGTDLTVYAAHLFENFTLVDWAYAQTPNSTVWAVRSDGVLLCLTYLREHAVWGWSRHDTDGVVENVRVVPEGDEDRVYLVVRRTVNGSTKRFVERMASRYVSDIDDAVFMDSALSYDGWNTGTTTMTLSGGVTWSYGETLTLTASAGFFVAGDVGNAIFLVLRNASGVETDRIRFTIAGYTSPTIVTGTPHKDVPAGFRAAALTSWAKAVDDFTGLTHLEGKSLAVLGDGFVVASPNNADYPVVTVAGGSIALGQPYAVVHAGLPFISDLETLDIDTPSGPSIKSRKRIVKQVAFMFEKTRGGFVGRAAPTGTDPLEGLDEFKPRDSESLDLPPDLTTGDDDVRVASGYDANGRVFLRQVDPLPMTVLAAIPRGDAG